MRYSRLKNARHCPLVVTMAILIGCAAEPVRVEFPADHPANPQALETPFTPPPNLFQTDMAVKHAEPAADSSMMPKQPQSTEEHSMDHQMDTEKNSKPRPKSKMQHDQDNSKQQHQEHNQ